MDNLKEKIKKILKKNKVKKAGIFGSYARGENKKNSDIDILIEVDKDYSLLDLARMKIQLEKAIKRNVDLVEYATIKPLIKNQILKEEVRIL